MLQNIVNIVSVYYYYYYTFGKHNCIQVLYTLNLSDIAWKFRTVAMFVAVGVPVNRSLLCAWFSGLFMVCYHISHSLVPAVKLKGKRFLQTPNFCSAFYRKKCFIFFECLLPCIISGPLLTSPTVVSSSQAYASAILVLPVIVHLKITYLPVLWHSVSLVQKLQGSTHTNSGSVVITSAYFLSLGNETILKLFVFKNVSF